MATARPAKRTSAKKAAPKKAAAKRVIRPELSALDEDAQKFLANAVMTHPGGCVDGKIQFIERLGLPQPPKTASVTVHLRVPLPDNVKITRGYIASGQKEAIEKKVAEHLEPLVKALGDGAYIDTEEAGTDSGVNVDSCINEYNDLGY